MKQKSNVTQPVVKQIHGTRFRRGGRAASNLGEMYAFCAEQWRILGERTEPEQAMGHWN